MEDCVAEFSVFVDDRQRNDGVGRFVGLEEDGFGGGIVVSRGSCDEGGGVCEGEEGCSGVDERREVDHFVFVLYCTTLIERNG